MATIIHPDGRRESLQAADDSQGLSLAEMQAAVGGLIETVPFSDEVEGVGLAFCNEEGLLDGLEFNQEASQQFGLHLVGRVLVLTPEESQRLL